MKNKKPIPTNSISFDGNSAKITGDNPINSEDDFWISPQDLFKDVETYYVSTIELMHPDEFSKKLIKDKKSKFQKPLSKLSDKNLNSINTNNIERFKKDKNNNK